MTKKNSPNRAELDFHISHKFKQENKNHIKFLELIESQDTNMVFGSGPAGTNKTFLSVLAGLKLIQNKEYERLIYIRSVVESADRNIGSLPGEIEDKFSPWTIPLMEKMEELIANKSVINRLICKNVIQSMPVNFARGRTFLNSFVIFDEAQNSSLQEIKTVLTRFGEGSKYVVLGDPLQSDINGKSGFFSIKEKFSNPQSEENGIFTINFGEEDIIRSGILKFIVERLEARDGATWQVGERR